MSETKALPVLFDKKENCCGCSACYSICPVHAISMKEDEEGFLYPQIDPDLCVRCYTCLSACSFQPDQKAKELA